MGLLRFEDDLNPTTRALQRHLMIASRLHDLAVPKRLSCYKGLNRGVAMFWFDDTEATYPMTNMQLCLNLLRTSLRILAEVRESLVLADAPGYLWLSRD